MAVYSKTVLYLCVFRAYFAFRLYFTFYIMYTVYRKEYMVTVHKIQYFSIRF